MLFESPDVFVLPAQFHSMMCEMKSLSLYIK